MTVEKTIQTLDKAADFGLAKTEAAESLSIPNAKEYGAISYLILKKLSKRDLLIRLTCKLI